MRFFMLLVLSLFIASLTIGKAIAETETYLVKPGDSLIKILKAHNYATSHRDLLPFVEQTMRLNPIHFKVRNPNRIQSGMTITLPENPNRPEPEPEPIPDPEPIPEPKPDPIPEPIIEPEVIPEPDPVIGSVTAKKGNIDILRNGEQIRINQTEPLYSSDTIKTNPGTVAEINLNDETRFSLGPDSELQINQFSFDAGQSNASPSGSLAAIIRRGAVRVITGLLAKFNANNYEIKSALSATIGVRGTDFTVRSCIVEALCGDLYGVSVAVQDGGISFSNEAAKVDLNINEFAQVQSATDTPVVAPVPEGFFDLELDASDISTDRSFWQKTVDWFRSII